MPPARSGVADYAQALLDALRQSGEVTLGRAADVNLYHIGNNQLHKDVYRRAIEEPGVVVLHDAVLHHFYLGALSLRQYVAEFVYNYGEWMRARATELWAGRARSAADVEYFSYPMLRRIAERSRVIIVHNPAAADMVRRHYPAARVIEIPHLFAGPPTSDPDGVERARTRLGATHRDCIFTVCGHLRESKRLHSVVRAFQKANAQNGILLLAGATVSSDLERALKAYSADPRIVRAGYLEEREFWNIARATDVCINLRYPSAGETSGIAVRFMGIGKPVLMSEGAEVSRIPQTACVRVETGVREQAMLAEYMRWLGEFARDRDEIGIRAAAHVTAHHGVRMVAGQFWEVLRSAA
jgi:hypothetical protein